MYRPRKRRKRGYRGKEGKERAKGGAGEEREGGELLRLRELETGCQRV